MTHPTFSILHVASEVAPFSQTGGLGDVARDLPAIQRRSGMRSIVISPLYGCVDRTELTKTKEEFVVTLGGQSFPCRKWTDSEDAHWFVDVPGLLDRAQLYNDEHGDYWDNPLRFGVFCKAASQLSKEFDLLHLHDWQSGLTALYNQGDRPSVISIHNLAYQGLCGFEWADRLEIPHHLRDFSGVEYYGQISLLKAGLVLADHISTVSPTYAHEIQSEPGGQGLSGLFAHRASTLTGILNGLDYQLWNPETDPALGSHFSVASLQNRAPNRASLFHEYRLTPGVLFTVVSRAAHQKGLHLIIDHIDELIEAGARFIWLTNGERDIMQTIESCAARHPGAFRLIPRFDPTVARRLYGGADFVLVPSLYEPCGLTQMMAMRYGSVPIVRSTGGLADTVIDGDTGLSFRDVSSTQCRNSILRGLALYKDTEAFTAMQLRCMKVDYSWSRAHTTYGLMYQQLVQQHSER
ncbi:MAG: glycogen synthase [Bradymonadia bacterium]